MIRDDVVLYADGGDLTVGRQTAVYSYGNFRVILPEGREQEPGDDRLAEGYISRPPTDRPTGRFDIGFVRADATIDLDAGISDLESVITAAQKRTSGDVFFERDITAAGLGRYRPGVDFDEGDLVQVDIGGKRMRLPVTAVEMVVSETDGTAGWRVHVGGQLISDAAALRKQNSDLEAQIAAEKRERLREVGEVRETATTAKSTAETAKSTAESARDLAGLIDLDLDGVVDVIAQGLDVEVPEGKETRAMFAIAQVLALAIQANQRAIAAETEARTLLEREATRMVWADAEKAVRNDDVKLSNPSWARSTVVECFGDWEGMVVLHVVTESVHPTGLVTGVKTWDTFQLRRFVTKTARTFSHNNGIGPSVLHSTLFYQKWSPGTTPEETTNNA